MDKTGAETWKKLGEKEENNLLKHFCYGKYNQINQENALTLPKEFPSSLSTKVKNLIIIHQRYDSDTELIMKNDLTLPLEKYKKTNLIHDAKTEDEEFVNAAKVIQKQSLIMEEYFQKLEIEDFTSHLSKKSIFISTKKLTYIFKLFKNNRSLLAFCNLSSAIENALGDLLNSEKLPVPTKLSEILDLKKLTELLGEDIIFLLKLMIGPLNGLNLRNICLHGFISTKEFPSCYTVFLMVLVLTISNKILSIESREMKNFTLEGIIFPKIQKPDHKELRIFLRESLFVVPGRVEGWMESIGDFFDGNHKDCLIMLFPLIEHGIRRIFVVVNECPDKMVTAEKDTLYTTMDILLSLNVGTSPNRIFDEIGIEASNAMFDLYIWNEGERLRDFISHGCVNFISDENAINVILIALGICVQYHLKNNNDSSFFNNLPDIAKISFDFLRNYKSLYHPRNILEKKILSFQTDLLDFEKLVKVSRNQDIKLDVEVDMNEDFEFEIDYLLNNLLKEDLKIKEKLHPVNLSEKDLNKFVVLKSVIEHLKEMILQFQEQYKQLFEKVIERTAWKRHRKYFKFLQIYLTIFRKIIQIFYYFLVIDLQKGYDQHVFVFDVTGSMLACLKKMEYKKMLEIFGCFIGTKTLEIQGISQKSRLKFKNIQIIEFTN